MRPIDDALLRQVAVPLLQSNVTGRSGTDQAEPELGLKIDPVNLTLKNFAHQRSRIVERNLAFIFFGVGFASGYRRKSGSVARSSPPDGDGEGRPRERVRTGGCGSNIKDYTNSCARLERRR